jgi:hypothetical protein
MTPLSTFLALRRTAEHVIPGREKNKRVTARLFLLSVTFCSLSLLGSVDSAGAESPWWHLSSSSRPTYLQPGREQNETWRLTVSATAGQYSLSKSLLAIHLKVGEPPAEVQAALEAGYGAGNVQVTGGAGPENNNPFEVYEIKFVGALAYRHPNFRGVDLDLKKRPEQGLTGGRKRLELKELAKGRPAGLVVVTAVNLGDASANPETQPVTLTDKLPAGLEAVWIEGSAGETVGTRGLANPLQCSLASLSCTFLGAHEIKQVAPYEPLQMRIAVNKIEARSGAVNEASVVGGGAPAARVKQSLTVSNAPIPFGVNTYEMRPEEEGGGVDTQAGSHPFQLTTTLTLNQELTLSDVEEFEGKPIALPKDLHFKLPPGLIGNPTPFAQCGLALFLLTEGSTCPQQSVVGVARVTVDVPGSGPVVFIPEVLYNIEPAVGEPARFGFEVYGTPVLLDTAVRTGGDYGVTVDARNISQVPGFVGSEVTFWGVPGDSRHDSQRGFNCLGTETPERREQFGCHALGEANPPPLLALPTSCTGPLQTSVEGDSWAEPLHPFAPVSNTEPMPALDRCNHLPFSAEIKVTPDGQQASKPTGLTVDVHVPQEGQLNGAGDAQSNIKDITVTLPQGVTLNPSAADGLQACSEAQIGYLAGESHPPSELHFTPRLPGSVAATAAGETEPLRPGVNFCPDSAKVATVKIKTPLLPNPLEGAVYLASPQNFQVFPQENPFETHVAMYLVAEDPVSGSLVKLPGKVSLNEATGQIESTFEDNPQLAFEDAELHFFGGERAPLASPSRCGTYTTNATFTPWSGEQPIQSSSSFQVTSGPNGSPCPGASLPFAPSLASGTTNINAGSFSALTTTLSRPDGNQNIQSVTLHYPPGLSGLLSGVELCPEPQANAGTCGPSSQIGETIVSVGVGGDPFTVTGGKAYITGPYQGAPFGLSIVNPAKAGPFNLQQGRPVVVRAKIEVDPHTAALTITTDPSGPHAIPTIIEGFPLQIQHVNVLVNRPGFTFNPTNCSPTKVTGVINSAEGASSPVEVPFQVTNCQALKFAPKFSVSTSGKTSKSRGASLTAKVTEPSEPQGSQSNITKVKVELPKQLPSRLTTLQRACTSKQFELNPANCPSESKIGYATVHTPLLPVPLQGPAIFVSHGNESFPSLTMVLQGYGVTIDLVGATFISPKGITSTTFKTVPDQPFSSFELTLPEGKFSALGANKNLCALTHAVTTKKTIKVKSHGKTKKVVKKTTKQVGESLIMPTEFVGQNGATFHQNTHVSVTGCAKAKPAKKAKKKGKRKK